jgi:hypothetical protein
MREGAEWERRNDTRRERDGRKNVDKVEKGLIRKIRERK